MSTDSKVKEGWVVQVGGKVKGGVHASRAAGREYARDKGLTGFKVVRESEAPATKPKATAKRGPKKAGGYVPKVRRQCADCGHYRPRDEQELVEREITFERGGKMVTQVRNVAVCANGCRENVR